MHTLILSATDLQQVIQEVGADQFMDELIQRLRHAFTSYEPSQTETPQRAGFHYTDPTGLIEWMPIHQRGKEVLIKIVGYHPMSPSRHGMPTIASTMTVFDTSTGHLTAMLDGALLTALRTGAASAAASEWLASADSRVLGMVGCGAQAVTQIHALVRRFELNQILVYDTDPHAVESLRSRCEAFLPDSVELRNAPLASIASEADLLCTATSVDVDAGPVIDLESTKPWLHVNAVGSDLPGKIELPVAFLERSLVCPDFLQQARVEGECQQLSASQVGPSIVEVAKSPARFRSHQQRCTVFDSTGWALEDWVVVQLALELAEQIGVGERKPVEGLASDPRSPYAFLQLAEVSSRRR